MNIETIKEKMNQAAAQVFGAMYFTPVEMLVQVPPEHKWNLEDKYVKAAIAYSGPQQADLEFYFPITLGINIAAGFIGVDENALSDDQIIDTMREAANMITGSFLGMIDAEGDCRLGIPKAEIVSDFSPTKLAGFSAIALTSDFGLLWIFIKP